MQLLEAAPTRQQIAGFLRPQKRGARRAFKRFLSESGLRFRSWCEQVCEIPVRNPGHYVAVSQSTASFNDEHPISSESPPDAPRPRLVQCNR